MTAIGIDIGGTHTRLALVDEGGRLLNAARFATPRHADPGEFVDQLSVNVLALMAEEKPGQGLAGVGLAVPGILDDARGAIVRAINLSFLEGFPLRDRLAESTGLAVRLMSDADAATWGEYRALGAASDHVQAFIHLRIGTGIGLGLVREGRLQVIEWPRVGHLGVLIVDESPSALPCRCGKRGCLDTLASGVALTEQVRALGLGADLAALEAAVQRGEPAAQRLLNQTSEAVQKALRRIADQLSPETIVIGGGVIAVLPSLVRALAVLPTSKTDGELRGPMSPIVTVARLGDDAGLIGAALLP